MIVMPFVKPARMPSDRRLAAGVRAEAQVAHYLDRAFGDDTPGVLVLHGLRLVDEEQREPDGGPRVAQIDHLLLHKHGVFIVESKSCSGTVRITESASGMDEWARQSEDTWRGMNSPLRQAERQGGVLRGVLQRHREELRGRVFGLVQGGFRNMPVQRIAAISEQGVIEKPEGWSPPSGEFADAVEKADNVGAFVHAELRAHAKGASILRGDVTSNYGGWFLKERELAATAELLRSMHRPAEPKTTTAARPRVRATRPNRDAVRPALHQACKACRATDTLSAMSGRYGYY